MKSVDWQKLSYVEYASAVEVLQTARFFRGQERTLRSVLRHCLDEYRHGDVFHAVYKRQPENFVKISTPHGLIALGGLSTSPFPTREAQLLAVCAYLYLGELRAIAFNDRIQAVEGAAELSRELELIGQDEQRHAKGLKAYLGKFPRHVVAWHLLLARVRFALSDGRRLGVYQSMKEGAERGLTRLVFAVLPFSVFRPAPEVLSLHSAIDKRRAMA